MLGAGVIAGTANLLNLLDLRPGPGAQGRRAAAASRCSPARPGGLVAGPARRRAPALLPADLDEEIMLGDAGANAYGALIGLAP